MKGDTFRRGGVKLILEQNTCRGGDTFPDRFLCVAERALSSEGAPSDVV